VKNESPEEKFNRLVLNFVVLALTVLGISIFLFLPYPVTDKIVLPSPPATDKIDYSQKPLSTKSDLGLNEVLSMGKQDHEHESLLSKIRKDLKIPRGLEIKVFVGPYIHISSEGRLVDTNHPLGFVLLLDEIFYRSLTSEEKIALISHELGHLTNEDIFTFYNPDTIIRFQIEADTYATKYARPEAMISVLNKFGSDKHSEILTRELFLRIQNLEKIKQSQQGSIH